MAFRQVITSAPNGPFAMVSGGWLQVVDELQANRKKGGPVTLVIEDASDLISDQSPVFNALLWVAANMTFQGVTAAGVAAGLPGRIDWTQPVEAEGVLLYERMLISILEKDGRYRIGSIQKDAEQVQSQITTAHDNLVAIEGQIAKIASAANASEIGRRERLSAIDASVAATEFSANERISDINQKISVISESAGIAIEQITNSSKETIENWFKAFKEQRQLEAPVALWEGRAENHEKNLGYRKWWMIAIGVIGLILAVGVALGAFECAHFLLSEAIVPTAGRLPFSVDGMRASFHFELLLSSAATLLYLTMYLWTMRLLVRLYTTEHHLALDARGRAALTETYLSLTKEGAATDADRAIMLGVIFRPVADGMVKEDGPPSVSPAALIASLASGTGKAG